MKRTLQLHERPSPDHLGAVVLCLAILILLCLAYPSGSRAQSANEKTFSSPGDAALALYKAAKSDDSGSLNAIFGSNADKVLHTGDEVADKNLLRSSPLTMSRCIASSSSRTRLPPFISEPTTGPCRSRW